MTSVGYQVVGRVATAGGAAVWQARDVYGVVEDGERASRS